MTEESSKTLGLDDVKLFTRGGCHIFAAALIERLQGEEYELTRIAIDYGPPYTQFSDPARHVACSRGSFIVHAPGVECWSEYEDRTKKEIVARAEPKPTHIVLSRHSMPIERLLVGVKRTRGCQGLVNEWGLTVDDDFVAEVRRRADRYISEHSDDLRVSAMTRAKG